MGRRKESRGEESRGEVGRREWQRGKQTVWCRAVRDLLREVVGRTVISIRRTGEERKDKEVEDDKKQTEMAGKRDEGKRKGRKR